MKNVAFGDIIRRKALSNIVTTEKTRASGRSRLRAMMLDGLR